MTTPHFAWQYKTALIWLTYLLLALLLTWPTVTQFSSHLPGNGGDDPAIAWNLWWLKYALLNEGQNPFHSDMLFYPLGINLTFYTLTLLNGLLALPVTLNLGVVASSNLHTWLSFIIGGYGTCLLIRYLFCRAGLPTGNQWLLPMVGGLFYAFASNQLFYVALGQYNIASNHWLPFAMLFVLRSHHRPGQPRQAFLAGLFLTLQAWAEMTYASFMVVWLFLYWLWQGRLLLHWPHLRAIFIMLSTFMIGLSPILAFMLPDMLTEGDFLVEGSGFAEAFSADLLGFIIPTMHHPFLGMMINHTTITNFTVGQQLYLGLVLLGLSFIAIVTIRQYRLLGFWLVATIIFAWLSLGPVITVNGQPTDIPGPFVIFQNLPFFKGNRYPSRYGVMLLLCLSILASFGLHHIGRHLNRPAYLMTVAFVSLLFLFEHLSVPLPQSDMRHPPAYSHLTTEPTDVTVLDIPFAWRNGFEIIGPLTNQFMFGQFYQTQHQKPLLQGNTSRNPKFKFQYFVQAPVINSLLALQTGHTLPTDRIHHDQQIATQVFDFFNINYIVIRPYSYSRFDGQQSQLVTHEAVIPYLETVLPLTKIVTESDITIYQVESTTSPKTNFRLDSHHPLARLYFGEGWGSLIPGQPIAAQRRASRLLLPLSPQPYRLTVKLRSLTETPQTIQLRLNDWLSPAQTVATTSTSHQFDIPAMAIQPGLNNLWLQFAQLTPVGNLSAQPIVTVISAGEEVGGFGSIFVNGQEVSPNGRGYNAAIIDPATGQLQTAHFDTHLEPTASADLARFINQAQPSDIIALAVADEASWNLGPEASQALQSLGVTTDLRGCFRCSQAIIRQSDGAILERLDPLQPVHLTTKFGLTEPYLAALIDWIQVETRDP